MPTKINHIMNSLLNLEKSSVKMGVKGFSVSDLSLKALNFINPANAAETETETQPILEPVVKPFRFTSEDMDSYKVTKDDGTEAIDGQDYEMKQRVVVVNKKEIINYILEPSDSIHVIFYQKKKVVKHIHFNIESGSWFLVFDDKKEYKLFMVTKKVPMVDLGEAKDNPFGMVIDQEIETIFSAQDFRDVDEYIERKDIADFYKDEESGVVFSFFIKIPWNRLDELQEAIPITAYLFIQKTEENDKILASLGSKVIERAFEVIGDRFNKRMLKLIYERY